MKIRNIVAVGLIASSLVACSVLPSFQSEIDKMTSVCRKAQPILTAAVPLLPKDLAEMASYPQAFCRDLLGGTTPATMDANSPKWLTGVLAGLSLAAKVAGFVILL